MVLNFGLFEIKIRAASSFAHEYMRDPFYLQFRPCHYLRKSVIYARFYFHKKVISALLATFFLRI